MSLQRYSYRAGKLHTVLQENGNLVFLRTLDGLFAEMRGPLTFLLATDLQGSVYRGKQVGYTCHGYDPINVEYAGRPGFNGESKESWASCYWLGNGYRLYSTLLMRFTSPDNLSPFGRGGLNTYAYCAGGPANRSDPSGHMFNPQTIRSWLQGARRYSSAGDMNSSHLGGTGLGLFFTDGGTSQSPAASQAHLSTLSGSSISVSSTTASPVLRRRGSEGALIHNPAIAVASSYHPESNASLARSGASTYYRELHWNELSNTEPQASREHLSRLAGSVAQPAAQRNGTTTAEQLGGRTPTLGELRRVPAIQDLVNELRTRTTDQ